MPSNVDPRLVSLYQRVLICKVFPAYKLHELRDAPAHELLLAMRLLDIAHQVTQPARD